ncbi:MAG: ATP-binding protein, partial [Desulfobacterales bacterium]|nr:ATP-binding protein [Desulfobacterales bacterium]
RLIGEDIDLKWLPRTALWPVKIDPSQVDQILANLCVNARDAIKDVGKITIETDNFHCDELHCRRHTGLEAGDYVTVRISDNGCGMNNTTIEKLFEPFFTTKDQDKGTGLGLATVYGIVKQNNGYISVESEIDEGTTFKIYIPRHSEKLEEPIGNDGRDEIRDGHETILLVEDETAILEMIKSMLERLGYVVLEANTPEEAIKISRAFEHDIDLLITDVVMPSMNGRDLAEKLLTVRPHMKCLFMSGYTANVIAHRGILDEGVNFINKPFSMPDLSVKLRNVLDQ